MRFNAPNAIASIGGGVEKGIELQRVLKNFLIKGICEPPPTKTTLSRSSNRNEFRFAILIVFVNSILMLSKSPFSISNSSSPFFDRLKIIFFYFSHYFV